MFEDISIFRFWSKAPAEGRRGTFTTVTLVQRAKKSPHVLGSYPSPPTPHPHNHIVEKCPITPTTTINQTHGVVHITIAVTAEVAVVVEVAVVPLDVGNVGGRQALRWTLLLLLLRLQLGNWRLWWLKHQQLLLLWLPLTRRLQRYCHLTTAG